MPVVCSKWESFGDIVDNEKTGWGYEFGDARRLYNTIVKIIKMDEESYTNIKKACLKKANSYNPENGIRPLVTRLK